MLICEKYNPVAIERGRLMTKKITPGKYFWPVMPLIVIPIVLAIVIRWEMIFFMVGSFFLLFVVFMFLDLVMDAEYHGKEWRPFNRKWTDRVGDLYHLNTGDNLGPEYRSKLIEYFDALRTGHNTSAEVESYLRSLYMAERDKMDTLDRLSHRSDTLKHIADSAIIERLRMEEEELRGMLK